MDKLTKILVIIGGMWGIIGTFVIFLSMGSIIPENHSGSLDLLEKVLFFPGYVGVLIFSKVAPQLIQLKVNRLVSVILLIMPGLVSGALIGAGISSIIKKVGATNINKPQ